MGKLFTSIINSRLRVFSDEFELLDKNQSGFRLGYSTIDNIFVLHILLELLKGTKKNMYCAFIDFEKAFDSVWRIGLWQILLSSNINGKCFRIIFNMYDSIRSRIVHNGDILVPIYVTLFNIIFHTGIIPTVWLEGNVILVIIQKER